MRRFLSLALAAAMLAGPASALAEFTTPAELLGAIETQARPQSFSATIKGHKDTTWFTVWVNGSSEGVQSDLMHAKLKTKMTVDIVQGDMKVRLKGQIVMKDGSVYAKLDSIDGAYNDEFMSFSALFGQKLWLKIPMDEAMMEMQAAMLGMDSSMTADQRNDMFTLEHTLFKAGHKYTLKMQPEFMDQFTQTLRDELGAQSIDSDDFFPFRELANDNADFVVTVDTNVQDKFLDSKFTFSWKAGDTEISANGTSQVQSGGVAVETPKNFWTLDDLTKHFEKLSGMPSTDDMILPIDETDGMYDEYSPEDEMGATDEWWQPSTDGETQYYSDDCWNPDLAPLKKLQMQRTGECPVEDINNRTYRN